VRARHLRQNDRRRGGRRSVFGVYVLLLKNKIDPFFFARLIIIRSAKILVLAWTISGSAPSWIQSTEDWTGSQLIEVTLRNQFVSIGN
jgi:hypothetical protein